MTPLQAVHEMFDRSRLRAKVKMQIAGQNGTGSVLEALIRLALRASRSNLVGRLPVGNADQFRVVEFVTMRVLVLTVSAPYTWIS